MDEFIRSGRAIDWILILIALEALAVLSYRAFTGRGPALTLLSATSLQERLCWSQCALRLRAHPGSGSGSA